MRVTSGYLVASLGAVVIGIVPLLVATSSESFGFVFGFLFPIPYFVISLAYLSFIIGYSKRHPIVDEEGRHAFSRFLDKTLFATLIIWVLALVKLLATENISELVSSRVIILAPILVPIFLFVLTRRTSKTSDGFFRTSLAFYFLSLLWSIVGSVWFLGYHFFDGLW